MAYDVVVVGGGIGGLTNAALLAARGVGVCLVERESRAGGCASTVEHSGHSFETCAGLYASWQPGEIHERVFQELPVEPPRVREVSPAYTVRMPGGEDVRVGGAVGEFNAILRASFPECAEAAVAFYREATEIADALQRAARRVPALATVSKLQRMRLAASEPRLAPRILAAQGDTAARRLVGTSPRFRHFVDAQLQIFAQVPSEECAYLYAALALAQPLRGMHAIGGGAQSLSHAPAAIIKTSGRGGPPHPTALRPPFPPHGPGAGAPPPRRQGNKTK